MNKKKQSLHELNDLFQESVIVVQIALAFALAKIQVRHTVLMQRMKIQRLL